METPSNEEGYIAPTRKDGCVDDHPMKHTSTCCKHEYMIERLHNLQIGQQRLEFQIQEIKANESKMMWKLIAVIGVTSFLCGYLGVHNWLNLLM